MSERVDYDDSAKKSGKGKILAIGGGIAAALAGGAIIAANTGTHYASAPVPSETFSTRAVSPAPSLGANKTSGKQAMQIKSIKNPDDVKSCADRADAYKGDPGTNLSSTAGKYASVNKDYVKKDASVLNTLGSCGNRIYIPQIGTLSSVVPQGFTKQFLNVPSEVWRVGWDSKTNDLASNSGNTLVAGHVDFNGVPGPFYKLSQVTPGALIYTTDVENKLKAWRVQSLKTYNKLALPDSVWSPNSSSRTLTLVTCGGDTGIVKTAQNGPYRGFLDNVVVTATPVAIN